MITSSLHSRGTTKGTTGCNLSVSFTTIFKKDNLSKSLSSTYLFIPTTCFSSCWSLFITLGCLKSSDMAHSNVVEDVSNAPPIMSNMIALMFVLSITFWLLWTSFGWCMSESKTSTKSMLPLLSLWFELLSLSWIICSKPLSSDLLAFFNLVVIP